MDYRNLKSEKIQSRPGPENRLSTFQKNYALCGQRHDLGRYIEQRAWEINSNVDVDKLKLAWSFAQNKFEDLGVGFDLKEENYLKVNKLTRLNWNFIDISEDFYLIEQEEKIKSIKADDMIKKYDLGEGNLFRVYIIKRAVDSYICLLSNHTAILDHQTFIALKKYVEEVYETMVTSPEVAIEIVPEINQIPSVPRQGSKTNNTAFLDYIRKTDGECDLNGLMLNSLCNGSNAYSNQIKYMENTIAVEGDNYKKLREFAAKNNVTIHSVLQYVWHRVISLYSNSSITTVGTLVNGTISSIDAGASLNILPLIIDHQTLSNKNNTVLGAIKSLDREIDRINEFRYEDLNGRIPIDNILFYEDTKGVALSDHKYYLNLNKSSIILKITEYANQLNINIVFNGNIYSRDRIMDVACIIEKLLHIIIDNPSEIASELNIVPEQLLKRVLVNFNKTEEKYLEDITMHELFEQQVALNPTNTAAVDDNTKITYEELDMVSNKLANHLIASGLKKGDVVGVSVHKSVNLVIALLAVIKAGGAYIPFATSYPTARLDAMLEDAKPPIMIVDHFIDEWLPKYDGKTVRIDSKKAAYHQEKDVKPDVDVQIDDLAYVIYTSGSTGEPKGVMIEHGKVVNTLQDINFQYSITAQDKAIVISNISFDLSVYDIFGLLAVGGAVVLPSAQNENDVHYLLDIIEKNSVTIWSSTPALMDWFISNLDGTEPNHQLKSVRLVLVSGDWIPLNLSENTRRKIPNKDLVVSGLGGATEVSIWSVHYPISKVDLSWRSIPYGSPLGNQTVYILDKNLKPVPVGAVGEMYIGGAGLAKGYFNQPSLTSDKFKNIKLKDIISGQEHDLRVYRTEDLGRYMDNGNIEFLGRSKSQVMINGLRVWPGVVETLIAQYCGIKQNIVLAKGQSDKHLVCYYVADHRLNEELIISFLSRNLSNHLLPKEFIKIDNVPLSRNGKLDRGALFNYAN